MNKEYNLAYAIPENKTCNKERESKIRDVSEQADRVVRDPQEQRGGNTSTQINPQLPDKDHCLGSGDSQG